MPISARKIHSWEPPTNQPGLYGIMCPQCGLTVLGTQDCAAKGSSGAVCSGPCKPTQRCGRRPQRTIGRQARSGHSHRRVSRNKGGSRRSAAPPAAAASLHAAWPAAPPRRSPATPLAVRNSITPLACCPKNVTKVRSMLLHLFLSVCRSARNAPPRHGAQNGQPPTATVQP